MEIIINECFGGYNLSDKVIMLYAKLKGISYHLVMPKTILRTDPDLIKVVKKLGQEASGRFAKLKIVEIPDGVEWEIDEYGGAEQVVEKHRIWG